MLTLKSVASLAFDDPCMAPPYHVNIIRLGHGKKRKNIKIRMLAHLMKFIHEKELRGYMNYHGKL